MSRRWPRSSIGRDHHVRVLAPFDPPDRLSQGPPPSVGRAPRGPALPASARPHRRLRRQRRRLQPRSSSPTRSPRCAASCADGDYDVVHVHEPIAPMIGGTRCSAPRRRWSAPSTPTRPRHSRTTSAPWPAPAAASTSSPPASPSPTPPPGPAGAGSGASYEIVPNGVDVDAAPAGPKTPSDELRVLFVGRPEERKGLPVLLTALGRPGRAGALPADRDRRRPRRRRSLHLRPRACQAHRRPRPRLER